jgi:hypothetical protein
VLLLLADTSASANANQVGNPGSKIFEYAGARRPILAFGHSNAVVENMLAASGLGCYARDEDSCMAAIRALHDRFRAGSFAPDVKPQWWPSSPRELAGRFAELLDEVTGEGVR